MAARSDGVKRLRVSILGLMVVIAIAGLDLAVGRALLTHRPDVAFGVVLCALALHLGLYRVIRGHRRARAFWAGFIAGGLLAACSYVWAMTYPRLSASIREAATGRVVTLTSSGAPLSRHWDAYLTFADACLERFSDRYDVLGQGGPLLAVTDAIISFLPQFVIALGGGLLFVFLDRAARAACSLRSRRCSAAASACRAARSRGLETVGASASLWTRGRKSS